jgi:hypothetical protein
MLNLPTYEELSVADPQTPSIIREDWRKGFERWCKEQRISVERKADGTYRYARVNVHWAAYFDKRRSLLATWDLRLLMRDEQP